MALKRGPLCSLRCKAILFRFLKEEVIGCEADCEAGQKNSGGGGLGCRQGQNIINGKSSRRKVAREEGDRKIVIFSGIYSWVCVYTMGMHVVYLNSKVAFFPVIT